MQIDGLVSQISYEKAKQLFQTPETPVDSSIVRYEIILNEGLASLKKHFKFALIYLPNAKFNNKIDFVSVDFIYEEKVCEDLLSKKPFKIFRGVTIKSCFAMPLFYSADISRSAGIIEDNLKTRKIDLTADFEKAVNFLNITKYPYYFNRGR